MGEVCERVQWVPMDRNTTYKYNPLKIAARSVGGVGTVSSGSVILGMCWFEGAA